MNDIEVMQKHIFFLQWIVRELVKKLGYEIIETKDKNGYIVDLVLKEIKET